LGDSDFVGWPVGQAHVFGRARINLGRLAISIRLMVPFSVTPASFALTMMFENS